MKILVTGACGLIGSEVVDHFARLGCSVFGVDNNMRQMFFGASGSTASTKERFFKAQYKNFSLFEFDICDAQKMDNLIFHIVPDVVIHAAAQPSHDKAAEIALLDFDVNARGTINLLEATRKHAPEATFIYMSTNKVYGDRPNTLELEELPTRYDYEGFELQHVGINEKMSIDGSMHSIFGASKVAADVMVQEYGRYFNMRTCCLRGGCLTGPNHSGVELHGFLSYLIKCAVKELPYKIYGYKMKQVRDNIHSCDVVNFMEQFIANPRVAEVYNIGGGYDNSISMMEAIEKVERMTKKRMKIEYVEQARKGDHICYYSDLSHMKAHYPRWKVTKNLTQIFEEIIESWQAR